MEKIPSSASPQIGQLDHPPRCPDCAQLSKKIEQLNSELDECHKKMVFMEMVIRGHNLTDQKLAEEKEKIRQAVSDPRLLFM